MIQFEWEKIAKLQGESIKVCEFILASAFGNDAIYI